MRRATTVALLLQAALAGAWVIGARGGGGGGGEAKKALETRGDWDFQLKFFADKKCDPRKYPGTSPLAPQVYFSQQVKKGECYDIGTPMKYFWLNNDDCKITTYVSQVDGFFPWSKPKCEDKIDEQEGKEDGCQALTKPKDLNGKVPVWGFRNVNFFTVECDD